MCLLRHVDVDSEPNRLLWPGAIDFVEFCEFVYEAIPEANRPNLKQGNRRARSRANSIALSTAEFNSRRGSVSGTEAAAHPLRPIKGGAAFTQHLVQRK